MPEGNPSCYFLVNGGRMVNRNVGQADDGLRIDDEGGLDAVFMVAYLRQLERDADSLKAAATKADRILNLIVERISECNGKAAIAILPDQLYQNKIAGVKSVVLGIENGYQEVKRRIVIRYQSE